MHRCLSRPTLWLALASVCSVGLFWWGDHSVERVPDTSTYASFPWDSLATSLSSLRTPGYPLFLAFCRSITPAGGDDLRFVPMAQAIILVLAAWVMYWGMRTGGYSSWTAGWCASTLMLGRASFKLGMVISTDSLAISLSLMATGCYLATTARRPGWWPWVGLSLLTFSTYMVRPAYLFLIPLWPVLCAIHGRFLLQPEASWFELLRRAGRYALVTIIPFLAYCGLRWGVVGHFGLVSFGGYNIIGVSGQFLDRAIVPELSEDLQPLANAILERRSNLATHPDFTAFKPPTDFLTMEEMFNAIVWGCAVPAAMDLKDNDNTRINRNLSRLANEIIQLRPLQYLTWLRWNAAHGCFNMIQLTATDRGVVWCALLAFLTHAWALVRRSRRLSSEARSTEDGTESKNDDGNEPIRNTSLTIRNRELELHLLFWTALGIASAKLLLVILVEPAIGRYMTGAVALFPAAIMVPVAHYMERIWRRT